MLFLRTFGGLSLENGGRPIVGAAGQRRRLAILAVLAVAGDRGVSRDSLYTLFWPESDIERARGALKQALYALRRDTDESALTLGTADIRLNAAVITSDVTKFDEAVRASDLATAVGLYAGPFLLGIHLREQEEFERWADGQRDRLAGSYRSALEQLGRSAVGNRDFPAAIEWGRRLTEVEPLNARFAALYMNAMIAGGDRDGAKRHGRRHAELTRSELGSEPEQTVTQILEELERNGPARVAGTRSRSSSSVSATPDAVERTQVQGDTPAPETPATFVHDAHKTSLRAGLRPGRKAALIGAAGVVALIAGVAVLKPSNNVDRPAPQHRPTIMVADFANATGDPNLESLGRMASDWVTQGLSNTRLTTVVDAGTGAAALRDLRKKGVDPYSAAREIAQATGATNVVTGTIYMSGDSVQIHARLTDATGAVRAMMDPVKVRKTEGLKGIELVRQKMLGVLAREFDPRFSDLVQSGGTPPLFEAYVEYIRGVNLVTEGDSKGAIPHFRKAYALDTGFVTALVWAVHAHQNLFQTKEASALIDSLMSRRDRLAPLDRYGIQAIHADLRQAEYDKISFARKAAEVAPASQWPWLAATWLLVANRPRDALRYLAMFDPSRGWMNSPSLQMNYWHVVSTARHMMGDNAGAFAATVRSKAVNPDAVKTEGMLARDLALVGREKEMWTPISRIITSRQPYTLEAMRRLALDLTRHSRHDLARAVADTTFALYRTFPVKPTEDEDRPIAQLYFYLDDYDRAQLEFEKLLRKYPKSDFLCEYRGMLALIAGLKGDTAQAVLLMKRIPDNGIFPGEGDYWRARVEAQVGDRVRAVQLLKSSFAKGGGNLWIWHSRRPDFPTLHGYPPFEELVTPER
ncbi:MAG TPA: BTAD domain-containing putative transcriptional regulator [Gemmatimonadaceae bacterium]|nr:BTAD domain-containing putative transcriptional regulator [Gemmatimonadaceae bacterium]